MKSKKTGRRRFLKDGAMLAGVAVGALASAGGQALTPTQSEPAAGANPSRPRNLQAGYPGGTGASPPYGERSPFERAVRVEGWTPLQDLVGVITPAPLHYVNTHYGIPEIDPRTHRLMIHGMVDRPLIFTLDDLKRLPSVSRVHFLECNDNGFATLRNAQTVQQAQGRTSCSEWTGVLLSTLLKEAGVQTGASWIVAEGADTGNHSKSIPLAKAMDDTIVAYAQNGEPMRPENGYPLRLVTPGFMGIDNVKWLRRIKVVDQPYMQKAESAGYASLRPDGKPRWFQFEMGPKSVITRPSGGQKLPGRGFYEITGLAWSGRGSIRKVEVSTDGGVTWKDAELQGPVHRIAHTRFQLGWNWNGEEAVLQSRCTDDLGTVQPTLAEMSKSWGVNMDYWRSTTNPLNHMNFILPWKVGRDGSIRNGILA
jgi:sulfane dehydrogenase subunit SoxC